MLGHVSKQTYVGRVIFPAKYVAGVNGGKPFLSFTLYVDKLAMNKARERTSGRITCSYTITNDNDPVAHILCKIFNKEKPEDGGLHGQQYKSVNVLVEGAEKLTEITDPSGKVMSNAYYKNLDYCSVKILDDSLLQLLRQHLGQNTGPEVGVQVQVETSVGSNNPFSDQKQVTPPPPQVQQPTQVPAKAAAPKQQSAKPAPAPTAELGETIIHNGVKYEFTGGDRNNLKNWRPVEQSAPASAPAPANPFEAASQPAEASGSGLNGVFEAQPPNPFD